MARIRTIKPEFWHSEALSELPEATHMLAAALLNYADDYGYFNANPGLIKAACCPLREPSVGIHESLMSLQTIGYIRLGTGSDGRRYGHVVEFETHQRVAHPSKSKIAAISISWETLVKPHEDFARDTETLRPEQGTGNREQGREEDARSRFPSVADERLALDAYNDLAKRIGLAEAKTLTTQRRAKLRQRLIGVGSLEAWRAAIANVGRSKFLRGETGKGWRADFDFILQEKSFVKLLEGGYADDKPATDQTKRVVVAGRETACRDQDVIREYTRLDAWMNRSRGPFGNRFWVAAWGDPPTDPDAVTSRLAKLHPVLWPSDSHPSQAVEG